MFYGLGDTAVAVCGTGLVKLIRAGVVEKETNDNNNNDGYIAIKTLADLIQKSNPKITQKKIKQSATAIADCASRIMTELSEPYRLKIVIFAGPRPGFVVKTKSAQINAAPSSLKTDSNNGRMKK